MNMEEIRKKVESKRWYHSYEIVPGIITPGQCRWSASNRLRQLNVPERLDGKTVLDIGAWDGILAFELEKRGATVYAADIQDPDRTAFNTAKEILKSNVIYSRTSIYDLTKQFSSQQFDYVFMFGVFYHLKNPICGFEQCAYICKSNGQVLFEGEVLLNYIEAFDGCRSKEFDVQKLAKTQQALAVFYPGKYKKANNWVVPNIACLKLWLNAAGLTMQKYVIEQEENTGHQRILGCAEKNASIPQEHPIL